MNADVQPSFTGHSAMDSPGAQRDMVGSLPHDVPSPVKLVQFDALARATDDPAELAAFMAQRPGFRVPRDWSEVVNTQAVMRNAQFLEKQGVSV